MKPLSALWIVSFAIGMGLAAPTPPSKQKQKSVTQTKPSSPSEERRAKWDTTAIHKLYIEADFEEAIDRCESGLNYVTQLSHDDSVFIFKHLGVMYTSKYETREKGKKFMMRLLEVEPTARIMDMYASDMIYMIFKNIQDEYDVAQMKLGRAQSLNKNQPERNNPGDGKSGTEKPAKSESSHWVPWTIAAVGVAGGAIIAVNLLSEPPTKKKENVLP